MKDDLNISSTSSYEPEVLQVHTSYEYTEYEKDKQIAVAKILDYLATPSNGDADNANDEGAYINCVTLAETYGLAVAGLGLIGNTATDLRISTLDK